MLIEYDAGAIAESFDRCFNYENKNWQPKQDYNLLFLKSVENHANSLLQMRGHVFLNEVYDMLDFPRTRGGAITGWLQGDFISFGSVFYENAVRLSFNVPGIIFDKI